MVTEISINEYVMRAPALEDVEAGGEIVAYAECWDVAKPHVRPCKIV